MKNEALRRRVNRFKESPRLKGDSWMYYENWLNGKAPQTQVHYLTFFIGFLKWLDTDTEGLYNLYLGWIRDDDPRKKKKMGILVSNYRKYLMETDGIKLVTTQNLSKAITAFFKANGLDFNVDENIKYDSVGTPNISLEQQSKILSATGSYKLKAYIKVGRDSGLRTGDIANLPVRVVRSALDDPSIEFHTFEWKTRKTGMMANPVLGPDCLDAVRTWMNYRVNTLGFSAEDGDPLFCVEKKINAYTDKSGRYVRESVGGGFMDDGNVGVSFRYLVKKTGLKPLPSNTRLPTFHSLRVFHKTTLEHAGIPTSWVNIMQGRKGEGTGGRYTKPDPEQLIEMFKKGYSALTGIEEGQQEKVDSLTHELGRSEYENAELRKERDEYRAGYEERARLQSMVDKARIDGWSEESIKKLEELLQNVETFEEGVTQFHKLKEEFELKEDQSEHWDYEVVNEAAEMTNYLNEGWIIFEKLNDGSFILRRQSR